MKNLKEEVKKILSDFVGENENVYYVLYEDGCGEGLSVVNEKWMRREEFIESMFSYWDEESFEDDDFISEEFGVKLIGGFFCKKYDKSDVEDFESEVVKSLGLKGVLSVEDGEYCMIGVYVE